MAEDSGKKRFIKDFLKEIQPGTRFVDGIRIERIVRLLGSDGEGSTAQSLSGRKISNITQLLEDDLKHTFDEGYFTFRFVAAKVGSGKTSLLTYLHQLTQTKSAYEKHCVIVEFKLTDVLGGRNDQSFIDKLYSHILADTFWQLLHKHNLSISVRNEAESILKDFLEKSEVAQLKETTKEMPFRNKFKRYITNIVDNFEEFLFEIISEISAVDTNFTIVCLIDELDALEPFEQEIKETRLLFKELIRKASQDFQSKVRLLIYLVGTSNNVNSFINEDSVIKSLVGHLVINLSKGYKNEFNLIKDKINKRIKGAYKGYNNFDKAWEEIQNIRLNPANTLREFCQEYASKVLEIHEKYFQEAPEQVFEGNARDLVLAQCKQKWASYLNKSTYSLSEVSTTTELEGHAFDCYVELLHNNKTVARAFGEAKNYELLSSHLQTFETWLKDVNFNPSPSNQTPADYAFMIAPDCPYLLRRKLELKNIEFIQADKVIQYEAEKQISQSIQPQQTSNSLNAVNVNTANKTLLSKTFRGTGFGRKKIEQLINNRPLQDLDDLACKVKFNDDVKNNIQQKIENGEICF